ncbi:MAG: hypothetical protein RL754_374 [Bacteroidota bacterium]
MKSMKPQDWVLILAVASITAVRVIMMTSIYWWIYSSVFSLLLLSNMLAERGSRWAKPVVLTLSFISLVLILILPVQHERFVLLMFGLLIQTMLVSHINFGHWKKRYAVTGLSAYLIIFSLSYSGFHLPIWDFGLGFNLFYLQYAPTVMALITVGYTLLTNRNYEKNYERNLSNNEELTWLRTILSLITHNIRTPLTTLKTTTSLIQLKLEKDRNSDLSEDFNRMERASDAADEIVSRLLRAAYAQESVNVEEVFSLADRIRMIYPDLAINEHPEFFVSQQREAIALQLAMEVFIDNAYKYGEPPVRAKFCKDGSISITDCGLGPSEETLSTFGELKEVSINQPVHGVGVPFSVRILKSINWSIKAERREDGFHIILAPIGAKA